MLRAFLYKISRKLSNFKTNFEDKASFIINISKSEFRSSVSEDETNGTEKSEISDAEFNTYLTLQSCNRTCTSPVFQKFPPENCPGKESSGNTVRLEIFSCVLVVNTNQWPLMEKAFAAWINMKYEICESYFKGIVSFVSEYIYFFSLGKSVFKNFKKIPLSEFFFSKVAGLNVITTLEIVLFHMYVSRI